MRTSLLLCVTWFESNKNIIQVYDGVKSIKFPYILQEKCEKFVPLLQINNNYKQSNTNRTRMDAT